ncbi:serine/threonine protein kinase-like protein [Gordonia neofelifaecis NRRL B-59395]|uniref:non-specific serine/threonine protein kinase n=2 Tax=Gordonia TaxID=2053 RepID=F1YGT0_9ACTN|nr:serine/threonine protein kinase-like protein [Gordonia neofelifaecis NRRL B-59395]
MGEVYLAAHPRLPRQDALKVLPAELTGDPTYRARFTREADLASQLDHPSIVSVYDRGEFRGQLWIAMKYIPGSDVDRLLQTAHVLDVDTACEVVGAVADALDYAHSRGMLHRDVKPANILVDESTPSRRKVYLTDFGIARATTSDTALTAANLTVGSIQYSSPEQLRGGELDGRTDQYALACTAFRLLTGRAPFPLATPTAIINAHLTAPAPSATAVLPTLAPAVDIVLARAMDKDPGQRYGSCREFAADLDGALRTPGFRPQPYGPRSNRGAYAPTAISAAPAVATPPSPAQQAAPPVQPPQAPSKPTPPTEVIAPSPTTPYAAPQSYPAGPSPQDRSPQNPGAQYGSAPYGGPAPQGPYGPPPGGYGRQPYGSGYPPEQPSDAGGRKGVLIAAAVLVILALVAVAGYFVLRDDSGSDTAAADTTSATTAQPPESASPSTPAGTDPAVVAGVPTQCAAGTTTQSTSAQTVASGPISIPPSDLPTTGWRPDNTSQVPFARAANGISASRPVGSSGWMAQITVGTLPSSFKTNTEAIARKLVDCLPSSPGYSMVDASPPQIEGVQNEKLDDKVTPYTLIRARIDVRNQRSGVPGDDLVVVVVNSSPMTFAFGSSPINDSATKAEVDKAIVNLQVKTGG